MTLEFDGERTVTLAFVRGELRKAFTFEMPVVLDKGVWRETDVYRRGDGVTWRGSYWIAQTDTKTKPDEVTRDWRLAVKRGRDGRHGVTT